MQPFQLIVRLTVSGELSLVLSVVTGPGSRSFLQTMTSSLVTQVPLLCNACSLVAVVLSKQNWNLFLEKDTVIVSLTLWKLGGVSFHSV